MMFETEPIVSVGLLQRAEPVSFRLQGDFTDASGSSVPEGTYRVRRDGEMLRCEGQRPFDSGELLFTSHGGQFSLQAIVGLEFHWQQEEVQRFSGHLRLVASNEHGITVINDVPLETYLTSVICSEMSALSPVELIKAHSVISRSWLLAQQLAASSESDRKVPPAARGREHIRWYDREVHSDFDVCADDHCQRYHGLDRIRSAGAHAAIEETRGLVLALDGRVCDARYGKCCGGVTEDWRVAWSDDEVPYLVPVFDGDSGELPTPPLVDDESFRAFLDDPPDVYCNCEDDRILDVVLPRRDRESTPDFFRWRAELSADRAGELVREQLGLDLGRLTALEPVERGLSGRLKRLRIVGEGGDIVIGKELEIRRALSDSHLLSSAFVVDTEGPAGRPETFVLRGAGWGHGVGLCQIGAAVMAWEGMGFERILAHYYPGARLERRYE